MSDSGLLLDTHCWIWISDGRRDLFRPSSVQAIEEASQAGRLLLSVISVWELAMLESKGRLRLRKPRHEWVREALEAPGLSLVPLSPEIAVESTRLPGEFHGDPADRIIVATARSLSARLLTRDRRIILYARRRHLSAALA
jgi:PIN domain nuclease of toxin-antitoxin system